MAPDATPPSAPDSAPPRLWLAGIRKVYPSVAANDGIDLTVGAGEIHAVLGELARRIAEVSERYGLPVDPRRHVHSLSVGERQRVEIIPCLLIMDEPTSALTPQAVQKLFGALRQLAAEGCSILYISHKLDELQALCHRATVRAAASSAATPTRPRRRPSRWRS